MTKGICTARRELAAAGIEAPALRASYLRCRALNTVHGRTYYLATLLLPVRKRAHVHALYGFARHADDLVDDLHASADERAERLESFATAFRAGLASGEPGGPVTRAVFDTIRRYDIDVALFDDFLRSMEMDLTVAGYATFGDLMNYAWGSAAVIGLQMLPVLGRADDATPWHVLAPHAADLGIAFQLTNFLRDVAEDLDRGRVYLPQDSLDAFGVDRARLERRRTDAAVRDLIAFEVERTRSIYRRARPGIDMVHPTSRHCLRTALTLYAGILDEIERAEFDVFGPRIRVGTRRRLAVASAGLAGALTTRGRRAPEPVRSPV